MSLKTEHLTQCEFCDLGDISRTLIMSWQIGSLKLPIQMQVSLIPLGTRSTFKSQEISPNIFCEKKRPIE